MALFVKANGRLPPRPDEGAAHLLPAASPGGAAPSALTDRTRHLEASAGACQVTLEVTWAPAPTLYSLMAGEPLSPRSPCRAPLPGHAAPINGPHVGPARISSEETSGPGA